MTVGATERLGGGGEDQLLALLPDQVFRRQNPRLRVLRLDDEPPTTDTVHF